MSGCQCRYARNGKAIGRQRCAIQHAVEFLHEQGAAHFAVESSRSVLINTIARGGDRGQWHTIIGAISLRVGRKMIYVLTIIVAPAVTIGVAVIVTFHQVINFVTLITLSCLRVRPGRDGTEITIHTIIRTVEHAASGPDNVERVSRTRGEYEYIRAGREINAIAVDLIIIWLASSGFHIAQTAVEVAL